MMAIQSECKVGNSKKEETKYSFNNKPLLPLTAVPKGIALFKWCHIVWPENLPKGIAKEYNSNTCSKCEGGIKNLAKINFGVCLSRFHSQVQEGGFPDHTPLAWHVRVMFPIRV